MKQLIFLFLSLLTIFIFVACTEKSADISGKDAADFIKAQIDYGFRIPGTKASENTADFIFTHLQSEGWIVNYQEFSKNGVQLRNIIAQNSSANPNVLLGTHFDTRRFSDQEANYQKQATPVVGANDGASGTALLLELSKLLINSNLPIGLVFFDGEDQGRIDGWDWIEGSKYFVNHLKYLPEKVVIVDMISDKDLNIHMEVNSTDSLCEEIWNTAESLGYEKYFINEEKYSLIDDHAPFLDKGIPACLVIDFDYAYWHTNADTLEQISPQSLEIVGEVILSWITDQGD